MLSVRVKSERLTYLSAEKLQRVETALSCALEQGVQGDILEFGVALGGSAILLATIATEHRRRFHGFDVFSVIPAPKSDKDDEKSKRRYEEIAAGASKGIQNDLYYGYRKDLYAEVVASFSRFGLPVDNQMVNLHKGLFEETWPRCDCSTVAFAHIDCDWYEPVKFCLDALAEVLAPGGVVVLDDYHTYGGARTAVDEFLATRQDFIFEDGANPILRHSAFVPKKA